ncbi:hypothetical protein HCH17_24285 [Klebsiella aerogenes]|uniref:hypothetical protein n=1 Tax=Enterobacteriaceae TaxID=543 RepID=UPI001C8C1BC1|nr:MULTISPECIES: hypothetical protein [Enterobacteriaceae]HCM9429550.1 hypothetical protein [Enterobacter hormaechei subsp. xiangfangensis]HED1421657.1 hypothetical protein [Kluyvera georgiana]HED3067407.1 hypothetical protein [Kluyvera ascorbata]EKT3984126.1 hypothetical protein [Klebsiella aerogenes]MBX9001800.1 hypothetical protein [Klebsiella aerogenes]
MNTAKQWVLKVVVSFLRRKQVPQHLWPEKIKKIGSWLFLGSTLPVFPLLFIDHVPLVIIIVLQILFLGCIFIGNFLVDYAKK